MGYAVLHLDKSSGNESAMTDHIERNTIAPNVDSSRTHLNKELIEFPEGVSNRTEAIAYRIDNAELSRKVGKNQVQVIRIILSGSHEDMLRIQAEGKIDNWCNDSIAWLENEFGKENLVAATLHLDEDTPHIHASIVPIVRGERRQKKTNKETSSPKRQYKKKKTDRPRLCADDVMTRVKLTQYHDTYAVAMSKYGLVRGENGIKTRHISYAEYLRNQKLQSNDLQLDIAQLLTQKEAEQKSLEEIKSKKSKEKFKNSAIDVGTSVMDGIGSLLGVSKTKKQQMEIEGLKTDNDNLKQELKELNNKISKMEKEHLSMTDKLKAELDKIHKLFPRIKEIFRIENLCKHLGFPEKLIRSILRMEPVEFKGKLFSSEHNRYFDTEHSIAELRKHPNEKNRLELTIDGKNPIVWFREKQKEFLGSLGYQIQHLPQVKKAKGIKR